MVKSETASASTHFTCNVFQRAYASTEKHAKVCTKNYPTISWRAFVKDAFTKPLLGIVVPVAYSTTTGFLLVEHSTHEGWELFYFTRDGREHFLYVPHSPTHPAPQVNWGWSGGPFLFCCLGDGCMDLPLALPPPNQPPSDLLVAEAAHTSRGFGFAVSHICRKAAGFVV